MNVSVLFFGITRDITNKSRDDFNLNEGATLALLDRAIVERYPNLSSKATYKWAVNETYCLDTSVKLNSGDEVALIPPVSGG
jgi:molybdopterin converting factor subunit 1